MPEKPVRSRVTINDIAREARVSISTVSRVVNQNVPVADETARRVWDAIKKLNYAPNSAAQRLASKKTNTLGLILPEISGTFFAPMLSGIERAFYEGGFDLLIYASANLDLKRIHRTPPIGEHNTDGLLVFTNSMDDEDLIRMHVNGFPVVLLHRSSPEGLQIPSVTFENKNGAMRMTDHLIEVHGCRRIAFLAGPEGNEDSAWRERGYRLSLQKHAIPFDPTLISQGGFEGPVAAQAIRLMLASQPWPEAIFCGDDESAAGVITTLVEMGIRIPEDIAVVGFDDDYLASYLPVALTTVRAPIERAGYEAAQQLVNLVRSGSAEPFVILPTEVIIRRSCGCRIENNLEQR